MKKKLTALSLALLLVLSLVPSALAVNFTDIAAHWARESITAMAEEKVVDGYPDGTFRPDATITRAELLTLVVRRYAPDASPSTVVPGDVAANAWYNSVIRKALGADLIPAEMITDNRINPDQAATREEAAAILALALKLPASTKALTYADRALISVWAVEGVAQCTEKGIFGGYPDGGFHPQGTITRAEVASVLHRAGASVPEQPDDPIVIEPVVVPLVNGVTGTETLAVNTYSVLTVSTNEAVNRLRILDSHGQLLGEASGTAASTWQITVKPLRAGAQTLYVYAATAADEHYGNAALTLPVTVASTPGTSTETTPGATGFLTVNSFKASTTAPVPGSAVTLTVVTNAATSRVGIYDASGTLVATGTSYVSSGPERTWTISYTMPADAGSVTLTACPGDGARYYTGADQVKKLTLKAKDTSKDPAVLSVKASDTTPELGDSVTITVTTNTNTSRVKLVNALGDTISEKKSGYSSSGGSRVWKFSVKATAVGTSWIRAYAGSSSGYTDTPAELTLTIGNAEPVIKSFTSNSYSPTVGSRITLTVTTDSSVRRVKLTDGSGNALATATSWQTVADQRIWSFTYTVRTAGEHTLRAYYSTSSSGSYASDYATVTLNTASVPMGINSVTPSTLTPNVGQVVTVSVVTDLTVTRVRIADLLGNSVVEQSAGYTDTAMGRVWNLALTPTTSGTCQYMVFPGNASGYSAAAAGFTLEVKGVAVPSSPAVVSVSVDRPNCMVGEAVTLTVTTNTAAQSVRLVDENGTVIHTASNFRTSGSYRIWTLQIRMVKAGSYTGYVQASAPGYGFSNATGKSVTLNASYAAAPDIRNVTQNTGALAFGICEIKVTTNNFVTNVALENSAGDWVSMVKDPDKTDSWSTTWTLRCQVSQLGSPYVTIVAGGSGADRMAFTVVM